MPVLMNKGDDPRQNSWLFFSTRTELSEWHDAIVGGRFESGTLAVDPDELAGAKKASTQVRVFLDVDTLVPEDIDIEQTFGVLVGTTTAQAARTYLQPREVDGKPWTPELPGLQMLAQLIGHMRSSGNGLPANVVWHLDADGILRMSPAKQVKAMAGNILKVKL